MDVRDWRCAHKSHFENEFGVHKSTRVKSVHEQMNTAPYFLMSLKASLIFFSHKKERNSRRMKFSYRDDDKSASREHVLEE
jgi:hypothetical protein